MQSDKLSYEQAGVSIQRGEDWVSLIKGLSRKHFPQPEHQSLIGGFAGLYPLGGDQYLAACADGVGSKLLLAKNLNQVKGLGQDLVAMNLNDLVTIGAKPLFFLDYIACEKLETDFFKPVMEGIYETCASCNCLILGGETAELPTLYHNKDFDLAGFCVGLVSEKNLSGKTEIQTGDFLLGLPSSGVHSNGYTLINKILSERQIDTGEIIADSVSLGDALLEPTKLYVNIALKSHETSMVKAMAHITGGGLKDNIERVLKGKKTELDYKAFDSPPVFNWLRNQGVEENEMRKVFNLGIGYVFVVSAENKKPFMDFLISNQEKPVIIGQVV